MSARMGGAMSQEAMDIAIEEAVRVDRLRFLFHTKWDKRIRAVKKSQLPHDRLRLIAATMIVKSPALPLLHMEYRALLFALSKGGQIKQPLKLAPYSDQPKNYYLAYQAAGGPLWRMRRPDILGYPFERVLNCLGWDDAAHDAVWSTLMEFQDLAVEIGGKALIQSE